MGRKPNETPEQRERRLRRWYILGIVGTTRFVGARLEAVQYDRRLSPGTRAVTADVLKALANLRHELSGDLERLNEEKD